MTTAHVRSVKRYEERMRADGFVRKHVWVPAEKAEEFTEYAEDLRARHSRVRTPTLKRLIANLRRHRRDLECEGVRHLSIFGSHARGEALPGSDLDVVVEFGPSDPPSLVEMSRLRRRLEQAVKIPVDIVQRSNLKGPLAEEIARDAVRVF
jgi:predicted nucleotidyltransferase